MLILDPRIYARLADEVYGMAPDLGRENSAARCVVRPTPDGQTFVFPGSDNLACWLADLECARIRTSLGQIHIGFNDAARSIYNDIRAIARPGCVLVGHSEGAALALIIAGLLCLDGQAPAAVFAFEPPHVTTDGALAGIFKAAGVRLLLTRNGSDVFPLVPRRLFDWQHPGPLTAIGAPPHAIPTLEDHYMSAVIPAVDTYATTLAFA